MSAAAQPPPAPPTPPARVSTRLTAVGAGMAVIGLLVVIMGVRLRELPLLLLGCGGPVAVLASYVLRPRFAGLSFCFQAPRRAVAGDVTQHLLHVHNRGRRATPPARLTHQVDGFGDVVLRIPGLAPGGVAAATAVRSARSRGTRSMHTLRVASSAPFGLVRREATWLTGCALVVHPPRVHGADPPGGAAEGDRSTAVPARSGSEPLGVRDYRPGDPVRHVHWRTTARRGQLVVVEPARTVGPRTVLVVAGMPADLPPPRPATPAGAVAHAAAAALAAEWERTIAQVGWAVARHLAEGGEAVLHACQPGLAPLATGDPETALDWFAALGPVQLPGPDALESILASTGPGDRVAVLATSGVPRAWWDTATTLAADRGRALLPAVPAGAGGAVP